MRIKIINISDANNPTINTLNCTAPMAQSKVYSMTIIELAVAIQLFELNLLVVNKPIIINIIRFAGTPTVKLSRAFPCIIISVMKIPIAAPQPPISGPNIAANTAGIITAIPQNLTTPIIGVKIPKNVRKPMAAYRAAFNEVIVSSRVRGIGFIKPYSTHINCRTKFQNKF